MEETLVKNFTSSEIKNQVGLILKSRFFVHSGTLSSFLHFIVQQTLEGRQHSIKEYVIATSVLSKSSDFNPQFDPIVRVNAGRLRRALSDYYLEEGKQDPIVISVPKGTYIPVFGSRSDHGSHSMLKEFALHTKPIVAVLPFRNINPNSPHIYFADGLADHISTELTQYPELSIIAYYSCRSLASKMEDTAEVAKLLKADFILTGTVHTDNDHLRVRIILVSCKTNEQIWAKTIDKVFSAKDLLEIEDEIASKVISQVAGYYGAIFRSLIRATKKSSKDSKIHNAIFWYYHFVNETNEAIFIPAEEALHQAVQTDPEYALGWAVLGEIKTAAYFMGYKSSKSPDLLKDAEDFGQKSLKLDPHCQHGYQTLALTHLFLHNRAEVLKIADNWSLLNYSSSGIHGGIGFCLICCGEYERGFTMLHDSISLNPYYQWWLNAGISFYYLHKAEYSEALIWAKKISMPHIPWEHILEATCYIYLGEKVLAEKKAADIRQQFPEIPANFGLYLSSFINDKKLNDQLFIAMKSLGF